MWYWRSSYCRRDSLISFAWSWEVLFLYSTCTYSNLLWAEASCWVMWRLIQLWPTKAQKIDKAGLCRLLDSVTTKQHRMPRFNQLGKILSVENRAIKYPCCSVNEKKKKEFEEPFTLCWQELGARKRERDRIGCFLTVNYSQVFLFLNNSLFDLIRLNRILYFRDLRSALQAVKDHGK